MRTSRPSIFPVFASALALLAAGCSVEPKVSAVSARLVSTSAEGSEVRLTLELDNENPAPVELTAWDYSVIVNDRTAYTGRWVASLTLPPKDKLRAELPAFVPASFGDLAGAPWRVGGTLGYRTTGKLDKLLFQLGINRLHAGFGAGASGFSPAPAPKAAATPAPTPGPTKSP
jgi:hypothetical protein